MINSKTSLEYKHLYKKYIVATSTNDTNNNGKAGAVLSATDLSAKISMDDPVRQSKSEAIASTITKKPQYLKHTEYTPQSAMYGFFTSEGGVSQEETRIIKKKDSNGNYVETPIQTAFGSLNVGVATQDKPESIIENIKIAYNKVLEDAHKPLNSWLFINETTYSNKVLKITDDNIETLKTANKYKEDSPFAPLNEFCTRVQGDGFVTNSKKVTLATVSGDAHSIVLVDEASGVIGIMAGSWKGIAKGLYENMVESMVELGANPKNIVTVIGPGIGKENYEFGLKDAAKYFYGSEKVTDLGKDGKPTDFEKGKDGKPNLDADGKPIPVYYRSSPEYQKFFPPKEGSTDKCNINFPDLLAYKAKAMGIGAVKDLEVDSLKDPRVYGARRYASTTGGSYSDVGRNFNFTSLVGESRQQEQKQNGPTR